MDRIFSRYPSISVLAAAVILWSAVLAFAGQPQINFDQGGVNISGLVKKMKAKNARHRRDRLRYPDWDRDLGRGRAAFSRTERDCAVISFSPEDPLTSERIYLESREYRERCYNYPDGRGGSYRECREEWVHTERRRVNVRVSGRGEMLPWERDVFRVCLDGRWLSAYVVDASYDYDLDVPGWNGGTVEARAGRKIRAQPDPHGIVSGVFAMDPATKNFKVEFTDRWTEYYAGENVELQVRLVRHHKNWFDATVLDKKITLPAAAAYQVSFADYLSDLTGDLKPGKRYYVKWRFKRVGKVSKDDWQKWRETDKAHYQGDRQNAPLREDPDEDFDRSMLQARAIR